MQSNSQLIYKLQVALNSKGLRILCNRSQFYSSQQNRPVTIYKVVQSITNPVTMKNNHKEIFSSASEIQIVLFMRNLWYALNGWDIPPTNQMKGADVFEAAWKNFEENELQSVLELSNNVHDNTSECPGSNEEESV